VSDGAPSIAAAAGSRSSAARRSARTELTIAWLIGAAAMTFIQTGSPGLVANDSYYHVRMAQLLPELGFTQRFPWLHWTIFRDQFVSHHHGFHVLLLPFAWVSQQLTGEGVWGAKAATAVAMGFTLVLAVLVLRELDARPRWLWLLLFGLLPAPYWLRLAYVRAPVVAMPLLLAALLLILRRRMWWLAVLGFVFTHVYGGFVLLPLVPLAFIGGDLLSGDSPRRSLHMVLATVAGGVLGLVLNPYFPANLRFLYTQVFETGLGAPADVGNEWRPYDSWFLARSIAPLAIVWLAALVHRLQSGVAIDARGVSLLLLNVGLLVLTIKARRFIEYWPIFALLSAASLATHRPLCEGGTIWRAAQAVAQRLWAQSVVITILAVGGALTLAEVRHQARPAHDVPALRDALAFLERNSTAGSLVFTDDWDVFPVCFYHNRHNTYAVGLDPVFTQSRWPALWERYKRITRGEAPAEMPRSLSDEFGRDIRLSDIGTVFGANYVLVCDDHAPFYRELSAATRDFERIYPPPSPEPRRSQPPVAIFRVLCKPAAREPG
jgi:hypothetical protein